MSFGGGLVCADRGAGGGTAAPPLSHAAICSLLAHAFYPLVLAAGLGRGGVKTSTCAHAGMARGRFNLTCLDVSSSMLSRSKQEE
jgi:hypothetical protein